MRIERFILSLAIVLIVGSSGKAETNYWEEIKQRTAREAPTLEQAKELKEYVEALSAEELLTAARQCSVEVEAQVAPADWDVAVGNLGFLFRYYPVRTNDLESISPLLEDMADSNESVFWRRAIMVLLGSAWSDNLSAEQCYETAKLMRAIYGDSSENSLVKPKAIGRAADLSLAAYSRNLRNDPNVKEFTREQEMGTEELVNAVRANAVKLAPKTIAANEKVFEEIGHALSIQLALFEKAETTTDVKISIIVAWARYEKYKLATPQVAEALNAAVSNYTDYDERLWYLLLKTRIEDFGGEVDRAKFEAMISDTQDEAQKKRLTRLQKRLKKD